MAKFEHRLYAPIVCICRQMPEIIQDYGPDEDEVAVHCKSCDTWSRGETEQEAFREWEMHGRHLSLNVPQAKDGS